MTYQLFFVVAALGGYLLGSIPFGLILTQLAGYGDIRKIGSGNIGATNVLRTGSKTLALLTVLLDALKAGLASYIACKLLPTDDFFILGHGTTINTFGALLAGSFGVLGHMFPIWLKFKGGKGVSSAFGWILVMSWQVAFFALAVWLFMAFVFRYSSLAALTAALSLPVAAFFELPPVYTAFYTLIALFVIYKHHANIARLIKGNESKISFKKNKKNAKKKK